MEQSAVFFAGEIKGHPIATMIIAFIIVCVLARICIGLMFSKRHMGDDDFLTIEDFYNSPKDPHL